MILVKLDYWLYQSPLIRYSTIVVILMIIIYGIWQFGLKSIYDHRLQQRLIYQNLVNDITLLEQQMTNYPTRFLLHEQNKWLKSQWQQIIFMTKQHAKIISEILIQNNLKLIDFNNQTETELIIFHVKVMGSFNEFLMFLEKLNQQPFYLKITRINIIRQNENLVFSCSFSTDISTVIL